jgi:hypothetical protein
MPSREGRAQNGPPRQRQQSRFQRDVVVQEAHEQTNGSPRLDRLTRLLSEALAHQLGHSQPEAQGRSTSLDYPANLSLTTGAKSAVPTEEE